MCMGHQGRTGEEGGREGEREEDNRRRSDVSGGKWWKCVVERRGRNW